jgi:hypothetical protein
MGRNETQQGCRDSRLPARVFGGPKGEGCPCAPGTYTTTSAFILCTQCKGGRLVPAPCLAQQWDSSAAVGHREAFCAVSMLRFTTTSSSKERHWGERPLSHWLVRAAPLVCRYWLAIQHTNDSSAVSDRGCTCFLTQSTCWLWLPRSVIPAAQFPPLGVGGRGGGALQQGECVTRPHTHVYTASNKHRARTQTDLGCSCQKLSEKPQRSTFK